MKKLLFSFILGFGFGAYGFASNKSDQTQLPQKNEQTKEKKSEKFNFSIYKFVVPKMSEQKDSLEKETPKSPEIKTKDETTFHYEKVLDFFKFS